MQNVWKNVYQICDLIEVLGFMVGISGIIVKGA